MIKIFKIFPALFLFFLVACNSDPVLDIDKEGIDDYVASCMNPEKIYDITQGARYSRNDETYQVNGYALYDSLILHTIEENTQNSATTRNIFYKEDLPVYVEEYISTFEEEESTVTERKIYLNGRDILEAEERTAVLDIEFEEFASVDLSVSDYDFDRPKNALFQEGEFEMKYGEFLILGAESYLILENPESKFGVALYIIKGDELLDNLYARPLDYEGKTLHFDYEFLEMNGIDRMIYHGAEVLESED
ncbi:MAG: hypothetical protein ACI857_000119 [Arenicella sp.]|jgi:hypothetical protein